MATTVVIDSGILISSVLAGPSTAKAKALLQHLKTDQVQIAAPTLLLYEVVAVMRKAVHQKLWTTKDAVEARNILLAYPLQLYIDDALLKRSFDLATHFNRPTAYDTQYLAVAERLGCEFWTADERLYNSVSRELAWVNWVNNFVET